MEFVLLRISSLLYCSVIVVQYSSGTWGACWQYHVTKTGKPRRPGWVRQSSRHRLSLHGFVIPVCRQYTRRHVSRSKGVWIRRASPSKAEHFNSSGCETMERGRVVRKVFFSCSVLPSCPAEKLGASWLGKYMRWFVPSRLVS